MRSKRIFLNESQKAETLGGYRGGAGCAMKGIKQGCQNTRIERKVQQKGLLKEAKMVVFSYNRKWRTEQG